MLGRLGGGMALGSARSGGRGAADSWATGSAVSRNGTDFTSAGGGTWDATNNFYSRAAIVGSQRLSLSGFAQPAADMLLALSPAQNVAPGYDAPWIAYWVTGGGVRVKTAGFTDRGVVIGAGSENPALPFTIDYDSAAQTITFAHNGGSLVLTSAHGVAAGMTLYAQGSFNAVGQQMLGAAHVPL